jgi:hypothetical protein
VDQADFVSFVAAAARRAVASDGRIGHLVLTQTRNLEPKLREPEMRHALAQVAEERSIYYGIEVPTTQGYRFTRKPGDRKTSARHDVVLLADAHHDADRSIPLELKRTQPRIDVNDYGADCRPIRKDFQKLLLRDGCGREKYAAPVPRGRQQHDSHPAEQVQRRPPSGNPAVAACGGPPRATGSD